MARLRGRFIESSDEIHKIYHEEGVLGQGLTKRTLLVSDVNHPSTLFTMTVQPNDRHLTAETGQLPKDFLDMCPQYLFVNLILPKHRNFVETLEILISPTHVFTITEYFFGKKLKHFCKVIDEAFARRLFQQLCDAVKECHSYGVVLNNLDARKIRLSGTDTEPILKIMSFHNALYWPELAQRTQPDFNPQLWPWLAVNRQRHIEAAGHQVPQDSTVVDVLALGEILQQMVSGLPMPALTQQACYSYITRTSNRPRTEIFDVKNGVLDLLAMIGPAPFRSQASNPTPTLATVLNHHWLTGKLPTPPIFSGPAYQQTLEQDLSNLNQRSGLAGMLERFRDIYTLPFLELQSQIQFKNAWPLIAKLIVGGSPTNDSLHIVASNTHSRRAVFRPVGYPNLKPLVVTGPIRTLYHLGLLYLRVLPPHPHIAPMVDFMVARNGYFTFVELQWTGQRMVQFISTANERSCQIIFKQMVQVVCFLHLYGVVHVRLKPGCFAFTDQTMTDCKLVTIHGCVYMPNRATLQYENFDWNRVYPTSWADRVLKNVEIVQLEVTALGRILHAMVLNRWEKNADDAARLHPPQGKWSAHGADLLSKIGPPPFGPPPHQRTMTVEEILQHPWLANPPP